jgi:hypothetical protein
MKKKEEKPKQLNLGLKSPLSNFIHIISYRISNSFRVFDLMKYAKDPTVWFINTAIVSLIVLQIFTLITTFNRLPTVLPLVEFYNLDSLKLAERDYILVIPAISIITLLITFILSYKWYNREKELVKLLMLITLFSTFALTVHILRLIAIY